MDEPQALNLKETLEKLVDLALNAAGEPVSDVASALLFSSATLAIANGVSWDAYEQMCRITYMAVARNTTPPPGSLLN